MLILHPATDDQDTVDATRTPDSDEPLCVQRAAQKGTPKPTMRTTTTIGNLDLLPKPVRRQGESSMGICSKGEGMRGSRFTQEQTINVLAGA
jgi:hypothetical protein